MSRERKQPREKHFTFGRHTELNRLAEDGVVRDGTDAVLTRRHESKTFEDTDRRHFAIVEYYAAQQFTATKNENKVSKIRQVFIKNIKKSTEN